MTNQTIEDPSLTSTNREIGNPSSRNIENSSRKTNGTNGRMMKRADDLSRRTAPTKIGNPSSRNIEDSSRKTNGTNGQNVWLLVHLSQMNHTIKSISWVEAGQLGKMCDSRSTYLERTILSSQFLGLKQGNWAKCVTLDPPISKEPYYQVNFLGWSRAIEQNVWLSIHLFQKNHSVESISWVEAEQLGKMYDFWSIYLKRTIMSSLFLGLKQANWAKFINLDPSILKEP